MCIPPLVVDEAEFAEAVQEKAHARGAGWFRFRSKVGEQQEQAPPNDPTLPVAVPENSTTELNLNALFRSPIELPLNVPEFRTTFAGADVGLTSLAQLSTTCQP